MRKLLRQSALIASLLTAGVSAPTFAQDSNGVTQEASQAVKDMSDTLSKGTYAFEFTTFREYEKEGLVLHIAHHAQVVVKRPDRLSVDIDGDDGNVRITYDGSKLTLFNVTQNRYVEMPITGSLETMLRAASEKFGVDFPLADLLADNPGQAVLSGAVYGTKIDDVTIDGDECGHFYFAQPPGIEFELWTESGKEPVPRRVVVSYRSLPGQPQFLATLSGWQLNVDAPDSEFTAEVPADATKVEEGEQQQ
jgi:hypothetical protein